MNDVIPFMDSQNLQEAPLKDEPTGIPYSKRIGEHLLDVMEKTTKNNVTPITIDALCKVTSELTKLMRLNLDIRRFEYESRKK